MSTVSAGHWQKKWELASCLWQALRTRVSGLWSLWVRDQVPLPATAGGVLEAGSRDHSAGQKSQAWHEELPVHRGLA